jgi:hypothetical protein
MDFPTPTPTAALPNTLVHVARQVTSAATSAPTSDSIYFLSTDYITISGFTNSHVTQPDKTVTLALPTCIQTIEPDANGHLPPGTCNALWNYYPSFGAALAFALLFGALIIAHIYQASRYKKVRVHLKPTPKAYTLTMPKKFCWVIIMAAIWETLAYMFRTVSTRHQMNNGIYLLSQIFVLLSPLCKSNPEMPLDESPCSASMY